MNPWEMILAHRYAEATSCYESMLRHDPANHDVLSSNGTALLCSGKLDEALVNFQAANKLASQRLRGESQPYLNDIGSILWLLGRSRDAIQIFEESVKGVEHGSIMFTDNAGGVSQGLLLWYAGVTVPNNQVRDHAVRYLQRLAKKRRIREWPGGLALFVLGLQSQQDLLFELCGATSLEESIKEAKGDLFKLRRLVKILFYSAVRQRFEGHENKCHELMVLCAGLENPVLEVEWYLARAESTKGLVDRKRAGINSNDK